LGTENLFSNQLSALLFCMMFFDVYHTPRFADFSKNFLTIFFGYSAAFSFLLGSLLFIVRKDPFLQLAQQCTEETDTLYKMDQAIDKGNNKNSTGYPVS